MSPAIPQVLRTVVAGDQTLMVEVIANALRVHGLDPLVLVLPEGGGRSVTVDDALTGRDLDAGVLISSLETRADLAAIGCLARTPVPWAVVTSAPRGAWWGAAQLVGADIVMDSRTPVTELMAGLAYLVDRGTGGGLPLSSELDSVWRAAAEERLAAEVRARVLTTDQERQLTQLRMGNRAAAVSDLGLLQALGIG